MVVGFHTSLMVLGYFEYNEGDSIGGAAVSLRSRSHIAPQGSRYSCEKKYNSLSIVPTYHLF